MALIKSSFSNIFDVGLDCTVDLVRWMQFGKDLDYA